MPRAVPGPGRARRFDDNCHLMMTLGELQRSTGEMWSDVGGSGVGQDVMGTMAFDLFEGEFRDIKVANTMHQGKTSQSAWRRACVICWILARLLWTSAGCLGQKSQIASHCSNCPLATNIAQASKFALDYFAHLIQDRQCNVLFRLEQSIRI